MEKSYENEVWKDVEGFNGEYQISNHGRLRSVDRWKQTNKGTRFYKGIVKNGRVKKTGYIHYSLWDKGKNTTFSAHRLVAEHFIVNPENKPAVNHIDGDKSNNSASNLEWVTFKENTRHALDNGLHSNKSGDEARFKKYTEKEILDVYRMKFEEFKSHKEINEKTGIPVPYISGLVTGKRRKELWVSYHNGLAK